jgi:hypothetical protein
MRRNCLRLGASRPLCLSIRREIKQILVIIGGILVLPSTYKILSYILLSRLTPHADEIIGDHQCGFRRNKSTTDHMLCVHRTLVLETKSEYNEAVYQLFINFKKVMFHLGGRFCIKFSLNLASP